MNDEDRIDLSALDPAHDARRWEALVARTVERSLPVPETVWSLIGRVRLGVVALAAVAALAWVPALFRAPASGPTASTSSDPALALMQYAHGGDVTALLELSDVE